MNKEIVHVYRIYFQTSGKCYIGQTNNMKRRMKEHLTKTQGYSLVRSALLKYDDWDVSVLHTCQSRNVANTIEIEEIRNHNCVSPNGYNLTSGGDANKHCDETRKKISQSHMGNQPTAETCAKLSAGRLGKKHTDEAKARMSASHIGNYSAGLKHPMTGKHHTAETKEKLRIASTGKTASPETRAKISVSNIGRHHTDEAKAKISAAKTGLAGEKNAFYGRRHTDETKAAMSAAQGGKNHPMYGKHRTDETNNKQRKSLFKTLFKKKMRQVEELKKSLLEQGIDIDTILEEQQDAQ